MSLRCRIDAETRVLDCHPYVRFSEALYLSHRNNDVLPQTLCTLLSRSALYRRTTSYYKERAAHNHFTCSMASAPSPSPPSSSSSSKPSTVNSSGRTRISALRDASFCLGAKHCECISLARQSPVVCRNSPPSHPQTSTATPRASTA